MSNVGVLQGVRVLIVEDKWHVASALKALLQAEGMEVIGPASQTADARRLTNERKPELAVVDLNLKGELAYFLIDELHNQGIHIVVLTGYAVLQGLGEKIAAVLQKPCKGPDLLAALRQALPPRAS